MTHCVSGYEYVILLRVSVAGHLTQLEVKQPLKQLSITPHAWHSPRGFNAVLLPSAKVAPITYTAH